jgi:hypothetical protein
VRPRRHAALLYGPSTYSLEDMSKTHSHSFGANAWPFDDPADVTALTTVHVLEGRLPVLLITHDEDDGMWQVLCGTTNDPKDGCIVCLGCLYEKDPTIGDVADLPRGWMAWRDALASPWQRERSAPEE